MNSQDFIKKLIVIAEGKAPDLQKAGAKAVKNIKKNEADKKAVDKKCADDKKACNVKESGVEFFRKYSDMIAEAEEIKEDEYDDEDPDVAKADSVKGKDGKTQKDADKKLPPWLQKKDAFDKKDKKDQDKGVKKTAKDKELDESSDSKKVDESASAKTLANKKATLQKLIKQKASGSPLGDVDQKIKNLRVEIRKLQAQSVDSK